jgi:hypothetical protein
MWPWEHLAVGYVLYSAYSRVRYGRPPSGAAAVAAVVASQLPDLVDKPLAWGLSALPGGRTLGHSLVFGVPLLVAFWLLVRRYDRPEIAVAASIAYLSHLLTDALYPALLPGGSVSFGFLLWPLLRGSGSSGTGFLSRLTELLANFGTYATSPAGLAYLAFDATLLGALVLLWVFDGLPGVAWLLPGRRHRS